MNGPADVEAVQLQKLLIPHGRAEELFGLSGLGLSGADSFGTMAPGPWSREQDGRFAAGVLGVLADNVLAQAVLAHRRPDMWAVTTELAFDFFAPPVEGQELTASARVLVVDAGGGGSRGRIIDESGGAVADVSVNRTLGDVP